MNAKVINIPIDKANSGKYLVFIEDIQKCIPPQDISLQINGDDIQASLVSLNLETFADMIKELSLKHDIDESANPFSMLLKRIENIKSYGLKSGKRLYIDYNKERKVSGRKEKVAKRGLHYYTRNNNFSDQNTILPNAYMDQIICADSEEFLKQLPDNCIDLIFTSPPYNFGLEYNSTNDDNDWESYFEKLFAIFSQCIRVLKWGGRIAINIQPLFSDYIPSHHIIGNFFIRNKMIWKGEILWEKNNYNCKYTAWGSWKSPGNPYLKYTWEFIEIYCKGALKKEGIKENIDINADQFKKWVLAKWSIAPERNMKEYAHPAMFPEELVQRVLRLFSYKGDTILDPFNGVGTTTFVAGQLERHYLGIDISKEYTARAINRMKSIPLQGWI